MQTLHWLQPVVLMTLGMALVGDARNCYVTFPPVHEGDDFITEYVACNEGKNYCLRGKLTDVGAKAIQEENRWPVTKGQVVSACVPTLEPPDESLYDWYEEGSLRVCGEDGCNRG